MRPCRSKSRTCWMRRYTQRHTLARPLRVCQLSHGISTNTAIAQQRPQTSQPSAHTTIRQNTMQRRVQQPALRRRHAGPDKQSMTSPCSRPPQPPPARAVRARLQRRQRRRQQQAQPALGQAQAQAQAQARGQRPRAVRALTCDGLGALLVGPWQPRCQEDDARAVHMLEVQLRVHNRRKEGLEGHVLLEEEGIIIGASCSLLLRGPAGE